MRYPYITIKFAETLDGRIAAKDGSSRWISGLGARRFVHSLRARNDAVLVGIGTILTDNPHLTVRLVRGKNPTRVIIDGRLRIPLNTKVVKSSHRIKTIVVAAPKASEEKALKLRQRGIEVLFVPVQNNRINLKETVGMLSDRGIRSILIEGGKETITSFLKAGLVDEVVAVISPKILGMGVECVGDLGIGTVGDALRLRLKSVKRFGEDVVIVATKREFSRI